MDEVRRFVGVDIAKAALDVFIGFTGTAFTVANDEVGIRDLVRQLVSSDFVIVEATGGSGNAGRQRTGGGGNRSRYS